MALVRKETSRDANYVYFDEEDPATGYQGWSYDPLPGGPEDNRRQMQAKAINALQTNMTYLGRTSPSTAQNTAQVQALTRQMNAIIKLVFNQLDDQTGT